MSLENLFKMKWKFKNQEIPVSWYDFPRIISIILSTRIITPEGAEEFLYPEKSSLYDPYRLKGIEKIVVRLSEALERREKVLIHGDYDVDGISGTALLFRTMDHLGFYVDHYIPNRASEGYGLSSKAIEKAQKEGFRILLTVDTGISALQSAYEAKFKGIDLIITDHHEPRKTRETSPHTLFDNQIAFEKERNNKTYGKPEPYILPDAYAILNPKLGDYIDTNLAGVGVAYKLLEALYTYLGEDLNELERHLDLVALGTVGDMVPLIKENRIFVKKGLAKLTNSEKPGVRALKEISGISNGDINPYHISFVLAPRINAAGRISHANDSLELLITEDEERARELAEHLQRLNSKRKDEEKRILDEAMDKVSKLDLNDNYLLVLDSEDWNFGVIGIVASKLVQEFRRPAILITFDQEMGRGSCRSIEEFDMHEALSRFSQFLEGFGGHKLACGLRIRRENLEQFKWELNQYALKMLRDIPLEPTLELDGEVNFKDLEENFADYYKYLKPFGMGNPEPIFALRDVNIDKTSIRVYKDKHVSFLLQVPRGELRCIFFDGYEYLKLLNEANKIDIAFSFIIKEDLSFELKIVDLKPTSQ